MLENQDTTSRYRGEILHYSCCMNVRVSNKNLYSKEDEISIEEFQSLPEEFQNNFQPNYLLGLEDYGEDWD